MALVQHTFKAEIFEWEWNIGLFGSQHLIGEFMLNGKGAPIPGDVVMGNKPSEPGSLDFADGKFTGGTRPRLVILIPGQSSINQNFHQTMWAQWDGAIIFFSSRSELDPGSTEPVPVEFPIDDNKPFIRLRRVLTTAPSDDPTQI